MRNFRGFLRLCTALALGCGTAGIGTAQGGAPPVAAAAQAPLYAIVYRAGPNWKPGVPPMDKQGLRDHFYYMRDLHGKGVIDLAGPLGADGGLVIIRARNQAAADRVVSADPAVTAGIFAGRAQPFVARFAGGGPVAPASRKP